MLATPVYLAGFLALMLGLALAVRWEWEKPRSVAAPTPVPEPVPGCGELLAVNREAAERVGYVAVAGGDRRYVAAALEAVQAALRATEAFTHPLALEQAAALREVAAGLRAVLGEEEGGSLLVAAGSGRLRAVREELGWRCR